MVEDRCSGRVGNIRDWVHVEIIKTISNLLIKTLYEGKHNATQKTKNMGSMCFTKIPSVNRGAREG